MINKCVTNNSNLHTRYLLLTKTSVTQGQFLRWRRKREQPGPEQKLPTTPATVGWLH